MTLGGFANRVAHIDLTTSKVSYEPIPEEWARKYIGARGLGDRYVFENGPQVDPLSPDNILCFMNGPMTGTEANLSGRMAVVTKSPLTGTVTDSHHGGWSAARLRWSGPDAVPTIFVKWTFLSWESAWDCRSWAPPSAER